MDDLRFGTRDKRGHWRPKDRLTVAPFFDLPWRPGAVIRALPGYLLPWNLSFFALGLVTWIWLTPGRDVLTTFGWDWAALILLRNVAIILVVYGGLELRLYVRRWQEGRSKYNPKFPADSRSEVFVFGHQVRDNILRTFLTGLPIWTAYEVFLLWTWANGIGPWGFVGDHPVWFAVLALLVPLIHEVHFYCIHRLIHVPVLYRWVHSVHHNSINPSPWSSLSMHPVEHLLYWSDSLVHLILPSHPMLAIYHLQLTGVGAVIGHVGFDRVEVGDRLSIPTRAYAHYLHHKHFEVNYSDGLVPLDKLFGTWHDGTEEADHAMLARFKAKKAQAQGRAETKTEQDK